MVDHIVDVLDRRSRVDIRVGVGQRRRWSACEPQHLFAWRKAARAGRLALPAEAAGLFVPVVVAPEKTAAAKPAGASVTIEIAGVVVRAECGVDIGWLADVLRAVKTAT